MGKGSCYPPFYEALCRKMNTRWKNRKVLINKTENPCDNLCVKCVQWNEKRFSRICLRLKNILPQKKFIHPHKNAHLLILIQTEYKNECFFSSQFCIRKKIHETLWVVCTHHIKKWRQKIAEIKETDDWIKMKKKFQIKKDK